ncbi:hypothetical protein [Hymenobacter volaticus]|uniref:Uncharacterized protein n=1 Tax=Hymenobacter volaticus TaxID=2932254 RepID=A0ABY4G905_9BACT|nr:hypothetical protein [Hymenobacter volaticus]UOQ67337.1 hypothetical protein MUN86_05495 [Hymenobacter volaticus]
MESSSSSNLSDELNPQNTVGERISFEKAAAWTATYQNDHAGSLQSVFYSADVFLKLLRQEGATGIRIYNAINPEGKECFVLVGATEEGDLTEEHHFAFDKGQGCPDTCVISSLARS